MRLRFYSSAILCSALVLASCKSDGSTAPVVDLTTITFASSLGINLAQMNKNSDGLYLQDAPAGTGAAAKKGDSLVVNYTGYYPNGTSFDTSVGKAAFGFRLGQGRVIAGWDEGLVGMKVGGTRKLVVPPSLGYGSTTQNGIPGNSVLVFTVQLISTFP